MKLSYAKQMTLCIGIILIFNILTTVCKHWIFHSIGFILCGLIWILHPVLMAKVENTPKNKRLTQIGGCMLILIGIFTRAYYY